MAAWMALSFCIAGLLNSMPTITVANNTDSTAIEPVLAHDDTFTNALWLQVASEAVR